MSVNRVNDEIGRTPGILNCAHLTKRNSGKPVENMAEAINLLVKQDNGPHPPQLPGAKDLPNTPIPKALQPQGKKPAPNDNNLPKADSQPLQNDKK